MSIRKARAADIKLIHKMVNEFARKEEMLPRALNELYEGVRDFVLYEERGELRGVCALRVLWEDLGEIRSLAVRDRYQGRGIGTKLLKRCLTEAKALGLERVFALTYHPEFFKKAGFRDIDKAKLPQKIWGDCMRCPKFPECNEHAVIIDL